MKRAQILVEDRTIPDAEGDLHEYEHLHPKGWDYLLKSHPAAAHSKGTAWFWGSEPCLSNGRDANEEEPPVLLRASVSDELASLRSELGQLRGQVLALTAASKPRVVVSSPLADWCEAHRSDLLAHPDSFVAIDPAKGIVCHSASNADFSIQLALLAPAYRATLMLTHSSMYK
jgi:hypothetical protein